MEDIKNLAKNRGPWQYRNMYPVENILMNWVETERHVGYSKNIHMKP